MERNHAPKKRTVLELETEIAQFTQRVSQLFDEQLIEAEARATDFVERESKLTGHLFLTVFTFGLSIYGTPSLNDLVGLLNLVAPHLEITRQGLHERINEHAVVFFEKMLAWSISLELPQRLSKEVQTLCPHFHLSRLRPDVKVYQCRNGEFEEFDLVHFAQKLRVSHAEIEV